MDPHESLWTLTELAEQAAAALADGAAGQSSGRVRDVPDARTIRWYQTTGLIDRPAALRGRTALYARRHLTQLVAIKRLQADGQPLAAIQARLTGASDGELEKLARLPRTLATAKPSPPPPAPPPAPAARARFWSAATPLPADDPVLDEPVAAGPQGDSPSPLPPVSDPLAVRLNVGVVLLIESTSSDGPLTSDDLSAIRAAAQPVLETLRSRGVLPAEGRSRNRSTKEPA